MNSQVTKFIFSTFREVFDFMSPNLCNYQAFSQSLAKQIQVKANDNIQYSFDVKLDEIVKKKLHEFQITGKIFSEESGSFEFGDQKYRVVYDPFCNSSLASLTFHEAAIGITIFDYNYRFISSAIMDYQTGIVGIVEDGVTHFYQIQTKEKIVINHNIQTSLENSRIVITLENAKERNGFDRVKEIFLQSSRAIIGSGHIYWLKLAMGVIDAYLDPIGGERLYEIFASTVAQARGCMVTDINGEKFDPAIYLRRMETDQQLLYYPVAATNEVLHAQILGMIAKS
jgi:fructose-1,6-bisphosphatase/inositol monophosphatase family enzyme